MNKKIVLILTFLGYANNTLFASGISLVVKNMLGALSSRGAQDVGDFVRADTELTPELLQDDKLNETLHNYLQEKYPSLLFVKNDRKSELVFWTENYNDIIARRNIIYIGSEWEKALVNQETKNKCLKQLDAIIRFYLQKNASGFYDQRMLVIAGIDVSLGIMSWNKFPRLQNTFGGRVKIGAIAFVIGLPVTTAINCALHEVYDCAYDKPNAVLNK